MGFPLVYIHTICENDDKIRWYFTKLSMLASSGACWESLGVILTSKMIPVDHYQKFSMVIRFVTFTMAHKIEIILIELELFAHL